MTSLKGRTLFITGGSRGIGLAMALKCASEGANVAIAAKTVEPHPQLEGTIHTAAELIARTGSRALALACDVRDEAQVEKAVANTVRHFGGIDICVNNASAIALTGTLDTPMKRYDLMHAVNGRGTYMVSKYCLPHLLRSPAPHILMIAPPLTLKPEWFGPHLAYASAKYAMSLAVLGLAEEFRGRVAVNALWPRTMIATAAIRNIVGGEDMMHRARKPEIVADAAHRIFLKPRSFTGNFLIDDNFLAAEGLRDFSQYRVDPSLDLAQDFFVPDIPAPPEPLNALT
jgi:citronellol/citronellal dehydrogenase